LFGPVWTVLYILIGISGWRLWLQAGRRAGSAVAAWGVQMVLNALWSGLFFGLHRPDIAFVEILMLWLAIAATITLAWPRDRWAAGLLVPYLGWVSFASALNFAIWRLNPIA
ncbi:MAG: TspO/MBR family protein, partial [Acidobacteriota bacterium]